jgi:5-methylcytosine-specific restriction protein A
VARALHACTQPGCPELVPRGGCPHHQLPRPPRWATSTRTERLPKDWAKRRLRILKRDNWTCYICGRPGADQVDHIQRGDNHDDTNLAAIHKDPCHRLKTDREGKEAQRAATRIRRGA